MFPRFMALLLAAGSASAQTPPDLPEWVRELRNAYAPLPGYLVTYRATGKDTQVDVTMGIDEESKLAVTHMKGTMRGKKVESRLWNTSDDRNFSDGGEELKVCKGVHGELACLKDIDLLLGVSPGKKPLADFLMTPRFMMGPKSLEPACNLRHKDVPNWMIDLSWSTLKESDKDSVTVESDRYGLIKFSRKTGMLIRQSVRGEDGSERVVEMKEFKADPGKAGIVAISAGWNTADAKPSSRMLLVRLLRGFVFQNLVSRVDSGEVELAKLERILHNEKELLRRFAGGMALDSEDDPKGCEILTRLIEESKARVIETWPGSETGKEREKVVEAYLSKAENRAEIRDEMTRRFTETPTSGEWVAKEFGGTRVWEFSAKTDAGDQAKNLLVATLVSAYFEAKLDGELAERWRR